MSSLPEVPGNKDFSPLLVAHAPRPRARVRFSLKGNPLLGVCHRRLFVLPLSLAARVISNFFLTSLSFSRWCVFPSSTPFPLASFFGDGLIVLLGPFLRCTRRLALPCPVLFSITTSSPPSGTPVPSVLKNFIRSPSPFSSSLEALRVVSSRPHSIGVPCTIAGFF